MPITYIKATGEQLEKLVSRIEEVVEGEQTSHIALACLIMAIYSQKPDIDVVKLQQVVKGVSEYMATTLTDDEVVN